MPKRRIRKTETKIIIKKNVGFGSMGENANRSTGKKGGLAGKDLVNKML